MRLVIVHVSKKEQARTPTEKEQKEVVITPQDPLCAWGAMLDHTHQ